MTTVSGESGHGDAVCIAALLRIHQRHTAWTARSQGGGEVCLSMVITRTTATKTPRYTALCDSIYLLFVSVGYSCISQAMVRIRSCDCDIDPAALPFPPYQQLSQMPT